ncbi:MAG: hypothetical protein R3E13_11280 [Alphaproteobacteria bacterium]
MAPDVNKSFAAKAGLALLSLGLTFLPAANAGAQSTHTQAAPQTVALNQTGKPVTLSVGPGFSPASAESMARVINSEGCPVTLRNDGFIPDSIDVEVNGRLANFTSVGSAGSFALRNCTPS